MKQKTLETFGIGVTARKSGLSAPTIRMWEKRYGVVSPQRTETNRRLYSRSDVERLSLLRELTERGHAIGNIAALTPAQLRKRLDEERAAHPVPVRRAKRGRCRLLTVGGELGTVLTTGGLLDVEHVAHIDDLSTAAADRKPAHADLAVIEADTLFPDTVSTVREFVKRTRASRIILLYRFTASKTATALARAIPGLQLMSAPVSDSALRRECLVQLDSLAPPSAQPPIDSGPIPDRLYTRDELAKLARLSTTVECECPKHLAGLLQSLSAFERYSRECEDRHPDDARLHAFLHRTTAAVRRRMEEALEHVVRAEGVDPDAPLPQRNTSDS